MALAKSLAKAVAGQVGAAALVATLFAATEARATPVDACAANNTGSGAFTCDLYEGNAGTPLALPGTPDGGYIVITTNLTDQSDLAAWQDVVELLPFAGASTIELLSDMANFPSYDTVKASPNAFLLEVLPVTTYRVPYGDGTNVYNFHLTADTDPNPPVNPTPPVTAVPEPAAWAVLGIGLLGLGLMRRRRMGPV